jgi:hypothetical protein
LEKDIEGSCCEWAYQKYKLCNFKVNVAGRKGWPDRVFFRKKGNIVTLFFVEFKRLGKTPTKLQKEIRKRIVERSGVSVYSTDNIETFKKICDAEIYS